jgi:hypothetical protein
MGLIVAQYAMGGIISTIGFSILAILWGVTAVLAIISIKKKAIIAHKKWMFISYGLTFAAITQRTLLLVPLLTDIKFIFIYRLSAWLPWMLNTIIAFYLFRNAELKNKIALNSLNNKITHPLPDQAKDELFFEKWVPGSKTIFLILSV